ncbi:MAG: four helix bundle suffix domain-containing protein [Pontiellaceae bacterium]|jgi:four helix bundle suffix protein|nr:four helix bundle suffix domain-containing protein [Pontiellaceae bacterium]
MKLTRRMLAEKLEWMAKLPEEKIPRDAEGLRELLCRVLRDVREVQGWVSAPSDSSDKSDGSARSDESGKTGERLIPKHGGYRRLKSFQTSEIVYDATAIFCDRFVGKRSRTHDQMVQAARSGRQNIAEGSMASATSKKTELKLTNVAKASLEELLLDYEDFLRQHKLRQWDKNDPQALSVRNRYREFPAEWFLNRCVSNQSDLSATSDEEKRELLDPYGVAKASAEVAANTILCLINQATFLLKRQIERLEKNFLEEGGFTERLYYSRKKRRENEPGK